MLHIALYQPEIPPNTGNIARMCAATGTPLHLIGRLGFRVDDRNLQRAAIDFWQHVDVRYHATLADFETALKDSRIFLLSARAKTPYTRISYRPDDCLLFGNESGGLPPELLQRSQDRTFCIPMPTGKVRCLNLATAAGIVLYEALRQVHG